jgi:hypothetical protein
VLERAKTLYALVSAVTMIGCSLCYYNILANPINLLLYNTVHFFLNPILFAICTSTRTFSKLCVTYILTYRRELNTVHGYQFVFLKIWDEAAGITF